MFRQGCLAYEITLVPRVRAPFGQHQESRPLDRSGSDWLCKQNRMKPEPTRFVSWFVRIGYEHAQSDGKFVNRGTFDSWCWPEGARPLGTRMLWDNVTPAYPDLTLFWCMAVGDLGLSLPGMYAEVRCRMQRFRNNHFGGKNCWGKEWHLHIRHMAKIAFRY